MILFLFLHPACGDDDAAGPVDAVEVFREGNDLVIRNDLVELRYHLTGGRYSIYDRDCSVVIDRAEAVVYSYVVLPRHKWRTSELPLVEWTSADATNVLGEGKSIRLIHGGRANAPTLIQTFALLEGLSCVLTSVDVTNTTDGRINVGAIYPLFAADPGALRFGADRDIRVMTNGTLNWLDFVTPLYPGTVPTLSNWSTLIYNQATGDSLSVGFLTYEVAQPVVYNAPGGLGEKQVLQAVAQYEPAKKVEANCSLTSELMILDFGQGTPHDAVETYGDRVKAWLDITTWLERHPEIGVPVGWNSWAGGGSSGGYGTNINEAVIVENMDFADRELRKWGMNYFQIDDGWEIEIGDWIVNTDRFPDHGDQNGLEWLLDRAKSFGFHAGLWIQAFSAEEGAQILVDHPEYFAPPLFGGLIEMTPTLDLSHPGARGHLTDMMEMLVDWGVEWVKLDFGYQAAMSANWHEDNLTRGEYYRKGLKLVRDTLGDDIFFLHVAIVGWTYGLVDSVRLTLDTMPVWEGEGDQPYTPLLMFGNQGLKPMYRDAARRYWLHGRLWVNHPDLIFFRAHAQPEFPPLTLNEAQTFATSVALQGGLVKIGDRIVDLTVDGVDTLRSMLPVYGVSGRPLDMMRRDFPEVWSLPVNDFDEPYHVLGLLNWGLNRDLTSVLYPFIEDADRELGATFSEMGLDENGSYLAFEFWTQEFLGEVTREIFIDVPARTPRVVFLRPKFDRPQLLGTNRHMIGGVGVIDSVEWDAATGTLTGMQEGSIGTEHAPFEHRLTFYVPDGFTAYEAEVAAPSGHTIENRSFASEDNIATLRFMVVEEDGRETLPGEWFPDIIWMVSF